MFDDELFDLNDPLMQTAMMDGMKFQTVLEKVQDNDPYTEEHKVYPGFTLVINSVREQLMHHLIEDCLPLGPIEGQATYEASVGNVLFEMMYSAYQLGREGYELFEVTHEPHGG
jgi:hypothetical protein